jgi:hypothetical protein
MPAVLVVVLIVSLLLWLFMSYWPASTVPVKAIVFVVVFVVLVLWLLGVSLPPLFHSSRLP